MEAAGVRVPTDQLRAHNTGMDGCKGRPCHAIIPPLLTRASYAFDIISLLKILINPPCVYSQIPFVTGS